MASIKTSAQIAAAGLSTLGLLFVVHAGISSVKNTTQQATAQEASPKTAQEQLVEQASTTDVPEWAAQVSDYYCANRKFGMDDAKAGYEAGISMMSNHQVLAAELGEMYRNQREQYMREFMAGVAAECPEIFDTNFKPQQPRTETHHGPAF